MGLYDRNFIVPVHQHHHHAQTTTTYLTETDKEVPQKSARTKITIHSDEVIKVGSSTSDVSLLNSASKTTANTPFIAKCEYDLPECLKIKKTDKSKQIKGGNTDKKWKYITIKDKLQLSREKKEVTQQQSRMTKIKGEFGELSNISSNFSLKTDFTKKRTKMLKKEKTEVSGEKKRNSNKKIQKNKKVVENKSKRGLRKQRSRRFDSKSSSTSADSTCGLIMADSDNSNYESLNDCLIAECLRDQEDKENFESNEITFGLHDIEYFDEDNFKLTEGDWVIVRFSTKKSIKHFVGKILFIKNNIPTVKFTRKVKETQCKKGTTFTYPKVDDICKISHTEDILTVLPEPTVTRRGQLIFTANFKNFNIQ